MSDRPALLGYIRLPAPPLSPAERATVDRFEQAEFPCAVCDEDGVVWSWIPPWPPGMTKQLIPCPRCSPDVP